MRHARCYVDVPGPSQETILNLHHLVQGLASRAAGLRPRSLLGRLGFAGRLALANSLLVIVVCVLHGWVLAHRYIDHASSEAIERGRRVSQYLARDAGRSLMGGLHELQLQARAQGGVAYVRFFDAHGLLLESGGSVPVGAAPTAPGRSDAGEPVRVTPELWEFQAPIVAGGGTGPRERLGTVAVGLSLASLEALRRRTLGTAILFASLFAAVAVLGVARLARAFTAPLDALAAAADRVGRGDFDVHVDVRARDEIGRLAASFNGMADSLRTNATLEAQVRELEEVARLKSEFLAAVSHELRTPLNVIIGYTEMLAAAGTLTAEQAGMLEAVRRYALLQLHLINNVLDYSRIASGKMSYHVERFALAPLLDEILTMHRGRHGDRALLLAASVDPDVPELETDRIKLHEIVRNLVDNAVKFTASGSVLVRARPGVRPAHVLIEVIDTGPGIRPDDLRHVFEAFQQTGPAGARHGGGVGLGLSIVKQLTEALGGHVSVASRPGEGSTFRVEIPGVLAPVSAPGDGAGAATAALEAVARNAAAAITERAAMSGAAGATRS